MLKLFHCIKYKKSINIVDYNSEIRSKTFYYPQYIYEDYTVGRNNVSNNDQDNNILTLTSSYENHTYSNNISFTMEFLISREVQILY